MNNCQNNRGVVYGVANVHLQTYLKHVRAMKKIGHVYMSLARFVEVVNDPRIVNKKFDEIRSAGNLITRSRSVVDISEFNIPVFRRHSWKR